MEATVPPAGEVKVAADGAAIVPEAPPASHEADYIAAQSTEALVSCANSGAASADRAEVEATIADPEPHAEDNSENADMLKASPKLSKLEVSALQALYAEVTGRQTRSVHRGSLIYRIREAQRGNSPRGPRSSRRNEDDKVMVLPVRMESRLVERLDEAWQSLGLRSRTELFRVALGIYLTSVGEADLAGQLATDA